MGTFNLELWLELLCRRRAVVLKIWPLVFAIIALGSIMWPPTYVSKAEILVQSNRAELLVSPGLQESYPTQPAASVSPVTEQDLNSEAELLRSSYLIEQALSGLPLPQETGVGTKVRKAVAAVLGLPALGYALIHQTAPVSPRRSWVLKIAEHLSITLIKRSNVIEVAFSSHDPLWSREFLTLFLSRYLEFHARISHDPEAEDFYQQQRTLLNQRLSHSEELLRSLQLQTGITQVAEQKQALITALYTAEADYRKTSAQLAATREQIAALQVQLARAPQRVAKESRMVQNLALGQIKPQVLQLETERAELLSRYRPSSARIVEIDAKLSAARKILERENHTEVQETTTDVNPTWSQLDSDLAKARADASSLQASQVAQARQLDELHKQLGNLTSDGVAIDRAQLQVDGDKEALLSYLRKGEEARAARALNQNKILNVNVVEKPTLPPVPAFPKLSINLAVGSVLGLALALAAAYWEESRDPKVCSIMAIAEVGGVPTIAVLGDGL